MRRLNERELADYQRGRGALIAGPAKLKGIKIAVGTTGPTISWSLSGPLAVRKIEVPVRASFARAYARIWLNLAMALRVMARLRRSTSLKEKLIKIGAKVVSHGRYIAFQMAEVAIPRDLFADILRLIAELVAA
jgi:hypothetical protein